MLDELKKLVAGESTKDLKRATKYLESLITDREARPLIKGGQVWRLDSGAEVLLIGVDEETVLPVHILDFARKRGEFVVIFNSTSRLPVAKNSIPPSGFREYLGIYTAFGGFTPA